MTDATVMLFDLDGVLIRPGGYQAALRTTLETVYRRMGLEDPAPDPIWFERMIAQGITNEWDMAALVTALALEQVLARCPAARLGDTLESAFQTVRACAPGRLGIDYSPLEHLAQLVGNQVTPSAALLADVRQGDGVFLRRLLDYPALLDELFANVGDIELAPLTRLHQHFVVGSREFERAFRRPAEFETPSCLELYDMPLLEAERHAALLESWRAGRLSLALLTARPSLPPRECEPLVGYTAEAELAARLAGLEALPKVGFGSLRYWGAAIGFSAEQLIKPEPGHALGALLAGLARSEWPALQEAGLLLKEGRLPAVEWLPKRLSVHVFEDSPIGIRATRRAVELLRGQGIQADLHAWGIAENPNKVRALQSEGARVFADVNLALENAINHR